MRTIHIVCARLRGKPCKECPAWRHDKQYGKVQAFCYGLAEELMNIVKHGGPWKEAAANRRWRKRAAKRRQSEVV